MIPGDISDFNLYPGTGCMLLVCFLSCVVSGGGPDILLNQRFREARAYVSYLSSVMVHSLCFHYRHLGPEGVNSTLGRVNTRRRKII